MMPIMQAAHQPQQHPVTPPAAPNAIDRCKSDQIRCNIASKQDNTKSGRDIVCSVALVVVEAYTRLRPFCWTAAMTTRSLPFISLEGTRVVVAVVFVFVELVVLELVISFVLLLLASLRTSCWAAQWLATMALFMPLEVPAVLLMLPEVLTPSLAATCLAMPVVRRDVWGRNEVAALAAVVADAMVLAMNRVG